MTWTCTKCNHVFTPDASQPAFGEVTTDNYDGFMRYVSELFKMSNDSETDLEKRTRESVVSDIRANVERAEKPLRERIAELEKQIEYTRNSYRVFMQQKTEALAEVSRLTAELEKAKESRVPCPADGHDVNWIGVEVLKAIVDAVEFEGHAQDNIGRRVLKLFTPKEPATENPNGAKPMKNIGVNELAKILHEAQTKHNLSWEDADELAAEAIEALRDDAPSADELARVRAEIRLRAEVLRVFDSDMNAVPDHSVAEAIEQLQRLHWLLSRERELMGKDWVTT